MRNCPRCAAPGLRVIYAALPMWFCAMRGCSLVWGFWSFVFQFMPFNGFFYSYPPGQYLRGLARWWKACGEFSDDDGAFGC